MTPSRRIFAVVFLALLPLLVAACDDDDYPPGLSQGGGESAICRDADRLRTSLQGMRSSLSELDEAALLQGMHRARAQLDSLSRSISEAGRDDIARDLQLAQVEFREFQRLLAQPQVSVTELEEQAGRISAGMTTIEGAAGCP